MHFRIADTFTDSLARLTGDEQKAVKTTAFDLQLNPANPGHQLHKLDKAKDKNFWSARVGSDIRIIIHKTASSLLLLLCEPPRQGLRLGGAAQAGDASEDRRGASCGPSSSR
jgi:mRNA-degrading endonuclease RelE of RelBE toxin-antitoxin system